MENCCNLYLMSTLACQLTDCLSEAEIAVLASDLATLGCMLSTNLARRALCNPQNSNNIEPITII